MDKKETANWPDFWKTDTGKRLKTITDELQQRVMKDCKNILIDHRAKLPSIFKAEDLWRKREAWVIAGICLDLVITGQAVSLIESEAGIVDWQNAHRFFWNRITQENRVYLPALAEQLKAQLRNDEAVKSKLDQFLFSAGLPNPLPTDFQWLEDGLFISQALENFERFIWRDLPEPEKRMLHFYLSTEQQRVFARLNGELGSLPIRDRAVADALAAYIKHMQPTEAEKLISDDQDARLAQHIQDFIEKYRRDFLPEKKSRVEECGEVWEQLKAQGKPCKAPDVCEALDPQKWERLTTGRRTAEKSEELTKWKRRVRKALARYHAKKTK